ncbi:hypothetical protein HPB48_021341 [Haemaphysalis longicornis]|uniref:PiggyBac transposable element-derived protein domain-containing protein n=1 Tax=Haemaphysalis longicornis TaxID=44386 RepID=A0A9J6GPQ0_HAELO|nr:hypothetical protein HPB48_021341 [Haemaphysalis longicornis]
MLKKKGQTSIRFYNKHKGEVDLNDLLISLYRTRMKTKKWPVKVIFHFNDLALVNSWLNYKEDTKEAGYTKSQMLHLLDFRLRSSCGSLSEPFSSHEFCCAVHSGICGSQGELSAIASPQDKTIKLPELFMFGVITHDDLLY